MRTLDARPCYLLARNYVVSCAVVGAHPDTSLPSFEEAAEMGRDGDGDGVSSAVDLLCARYARYTALDGASVHAAPS